MRRAEPEDDDDDDGDDDDDSTQRQRHDTGDTVQNPDPMTQGGTAMRRKVAPHSRGELVGLHSQNLVRHFSEAKSLCNRDLSLCHI